MLKRKKIFLTLLVFLLIFLVGCSEVVMQTKAAKEALAQASSQITIATPSPSETNSSANEQIQQNEEMNKRVASIRSLEDYTKIYSIYNTFASTYAYLGITINENYVKEGDVSPCLIVYVYGKEDWCVQTQLDENGMISFGVTMPIAFTQQDSTLLHISSLLSETCTFYGDEIEPEIIKAFIINNSKNTATEKSTYLGKFKVSIDIEDDFITINFKP